MFFICKYNLHVYTGKICTPGAADVFRKRANSGGGGRLHFYLLLSFLAELGTVAGNKVWFTTSSSGGWTTQLKKTTFALGIVLLRVYRQKHATDSSLCCSLIEEFLCKKVRHSTVSGWSWALAVKGFLRYGSQGWIFTAIDRLLWILSRLASRSWTVSNNFSALLRRGLRASLSWSICVKRRSICGIHSFV